MVEDAEKLMEGFLGVDSSCKQGVTLDALCSSLRTGRVGLDNMMYDAFGMSGEEILVQLRRRKPLIDD